MVTRGRTSAQASAGRRGRRTLRFARGRAVTGACPSSGPAGPPSPKGEGKGCSGGIHPSRGVGGNGRSRRGGGTPPYGCNSRKRCRGGLYAAREFVRDAFAGCCFSFNIGLAIRLKMYPRCRAWTFDNRLHPTLFSVQLHLCF